MRIKIRSGLATVTLFAATPALAHPGHGESGGLLGGLLHPLTGVDHLAVMLLIGIWSAFVFPRALLVLPAAFMGGMSAGFLLGSLLPGASVELIVLLSFPLLFGAMLAGRSLPLAAAAGLTVMFATAHGYAHASEASVDVLAFAGGMLASTAMLHGVGLLAGRVLSRRAHGALRARLRRQTAL